MDRRSIGDFALRVVVVLALVAFALLLWRVRDMLLLLFGGILVAVILRASAAGVRRLLPVGEMVALALATLAIGAVLAGILILFGREVSAQFGELGQALPGAWETFEQRVGSDRMEQAVERFVPQGSTIASLFATAMNVVTATLSGLMLAILGGIYLAIDPATYRRGLVRLFPTAARDRVMRAGDATAQSLRAWLVGQLVSMAVVGVLTWGGLMLLGVPSALALGLIAALLEFVPLIGPIVAAIPGVLIALTLGTETFALTLGLYLLIQQFEGNVLAPLVMRKSVSIPPAVTLFALFLFGGLFGPIGVMLGGPLTVVAFVLTRELWLGEDVAAD